MSIVASTFGIVFELTVERDLSCRVNHTGAQEGKSAVCD